ncbi:MAG TPA: alanine racemase [Acidimicrobiia bacterium]|nr:alanine racemase [Acidimicrobiia bacterium]
MSGSRPTWADIDLDAVRANVATLRDHSAPAALLAVVKSDGYGHGAVAIARAALDAGAEWLGVALVEEGVALRAAGIRAPVLVLSQPAPASAADVVAHDLTPVVDTAAGIDALARAAGPEPLAVHLKVDTGMHRVGCAPADALGLARDITSRAALRLGGVCTHFAVADEPDDPYTGEQLHAFGGVLADLERAGIDPGIVHAANTAGALSFPDARFDLVRVGIGVYGIAPAPALAGIVRLRPALALRSRVSHVRRLPAGSRISYGLWYRLARDATIATVPIGYGDGVPRALATQGGQVLVGGKRRPIAGTITMDQLMVDVGDDPVDVGDDVVLIGGQGDETITADEWARRMDTIAYEVVCGIGPRVPRRYSGADT